ncbi:MAG: WHG domain-containing protein [Trueperaceae bacterium]|nr:MAG: WHG domain-containing protein [Trueperaceae bacterium]
MPPRPRLNEQLLIEEAIVLIDREGPQGLSLATLAAKLGVKPPSLYNHVQGLPGLERALTLRGLEELSKALRDAAVGRAGSDALRAIAHAYRTFAKQHPGLYAMTQRSQEGRDEEIQAAAWQAVEVVLRVLEAFDLKGDEAIHATRCLRSALHGFVTLEATEGFGLSLEIDASFEKLLTMVDGGLRAAFSS